MNKKYLYEKEDLVAIVETINISLKEKLPPFDFLVFSFIKSMCLEIMENRRRLDENIYSVSQIEEKERIKHRE